MCVCVCGWVYVWLGVLDVLLPCTAYFILGVILNLHSLTTMLQHKICSLESGSISLLKISFLSNLHLCLEQQASDMLILYEVHHIRGYAVDLSCS